jgi:hypothetical protein
MQAPVAPAAASVAAPEVATTNQAAFTWLQLRRVDTVGGAGQDEAKDVLLVRYVHDGWTMFHNHRHTR